MDFSVTSINKLLSAKKYHTLLSFVKGFRNGAVYGVKVRFPHALVMSILFKDATLLSHAQGIVEATLMHSKNLALLCVGYKMLMACMKRLQSTTHPHHPFLAAFVCGYFIFGQYNKITEQINLYLLSRILAALVKVAMAKGYLPTPKVDTYPWYAGCVWGTVLWLFEYHQQHLQQGLQSSMTYIFHDSNTWQNLRNFLLYNS